MKLLAVLYLFGLVAVTVAYKIPDEQEREKRFLFGKREISVADKIPDEHGREKRFLMGKREIKVADKIPDEHDREKRFLIGKREISVADKIPDEHDREKRFLFGQCRVNSDCGVDRCCSIIGTCHNKRGLNQSCNFIAIRSCSQCRSGLSCQPLYLGSLKVWNRCRPIPTEEPGSGDI